MFRVITGGTLSKTFFLINCSSEVFAHFSMLGILPILLKAEISVYWPKMTTFISTYNLGQEQKVQINNIRMDKLYSANNLQLALTNRC